MQPIKYFLSGIYKSAEGISRLFVHKNDNNMLQKGKVISFQECIDIIRNGDVVMAIRWDYETGAWKYISTVEIEMVNGEPSLYLRPSKDGTCLNNLVDFATFEPLVNQVVPLIRRRISKSTEK